MTWSGRRQLIILAIVAVAAIILILLIVPLRKDPTCFDGKFNGNEKGIDCGGDCPLLCIQQTSDIVALWTRVFEVVPSVYNVVVYMENQNVNGALYSIPYEFRLYDEENVFIAKREGETFISPNSNSAIFESAINVGNRIPVRATFEFTAQPQWIQIDRDFWDSLDVIVEHKDITDSGSSPKLVATLRNDSLYDIPDLDVIAALYDRQGNALGVSKTFIDKLEKNTSKDIFFTWPKPLKDTVFKIEILPRINIFDIGF